MKKSIKKSRHKLNLGCGSHILRGHVNLDSLSLKGVDIIHDLNLYPYPFKNDYFDYVLCDNVLEHLDDVIRVMEELHRITRSGGIIEVVVPYFSSIGAFRDPTHKHFFTLRSFDYFTKDFEYNFYSKVRFVILGRRLLFSKRLKLFEHMFDRIPLVYETLLAYILPASAIVFRLEVSK